LCGSFPFVVGLYKAKTIIEFLSWWIMKIVIEAFVVSVLLGEMS